MIIITCHTCPTISSVEVADPWCEVEIGQTVKLHLLDNPSHVVKVVLK